MLTLNFPGLGTVISKAILPECSRLTGPQKCYAAAIVHMAKTEWQFNQEGGYLKPVEYRQIATVFGVQQRAVEKDVGSLSARFQSRECPPWISVADATPLIWSVDLVALPRSVQDLYQTAILALAEQYLEMCVQRERRPFARGYETIAAAFNVPVDIVRDDYLALGGRLVEARLGWRRIAA